MLYYQGRVLAKQTMIAEWLNGPSISGELDVDSQVKAVVHKRLSIRSMVESVLPEFNGDVITSEQLKLAVFSRYPEEHDRIKPQIRCAINEVATTHPRLKRVDGGYVKL